MQKKTIITSILLLFVVACVVVLVAREVQDKPETASNLTDGSASPGSEQTAAASQQSEQKIIAYYFHGYKRCRTCLSIEAYAKEALESGFPDAIKKGRLEWRAINMEEEANKHYVEQYQLAASSLILFSPNGKQKSKWKNLNEIWPLVHNKDEFINYVPNKCPECNTERDSLEVKSGYHHCPKCNFKFPSVKLGLGGGLAIGTLIGLGIAGIIYLLTKKD